MLLRLSSVGKTFRSKRGIHRILSDISVTIQPGECLALMGPNGVGKSTLAGIIAGIDDDFEGRVERADGLAPQSPMVFQDFKASLLPWLSVEANIAFPLMLKGVPSKERRRLAQAAIASAPRRLDVHTAVRKLSGGQAQLVSILRALIVSPSLLICDEPFSAIDYPARILLRRLIATTCRTGGVALVFVTHSIEDALFLSNRILILGGNPASIVFDVPVGVACHRDENWLDNPENIQRRRYLREALARTALDFTFGDQTNGYEPSTPLSAGMVENVGSVEEG